MFSGRASLGPTGKRPFSTRETPALSDRERGLKKVGHKVGDEEEKRKEKSIVVSQNLIHLVVPPTFLSGSTPLRVIL